MCSVSFDAIITYNKGFLLKGMLYYLNVSCNLWQSLHLSLYIFGGIYKTTVLIDVILCQCELSYKISCISLGAVIYILPL